MNESRSAVPAATTLPGTLRKITETLARELASPTLRPPSWSDFEWNIARAVAAMHGVSPLLSKTLRWRGPAAWMVFLEEQQTHTAARHRRITELLTDIDERGRTEGVAAVALKGAALHAIGLYAIGERPMADIDLLVKPADAERTARLVESLGFYEARANWRERLFIPVAAHAAGALGEHSSNNIKIEIHTRICERLPWRITDITDGVFPPQARPGVNAYPSTASLMSHLLLHAAGAMAFQGLRLLHLHDLAQLSSRMTQADWDQVLAQRGRGGRLWWAFPPLNLAARYFSSRIPSRILAVLAEDCPFVLDMASRRRTLYDVSYSYPRVDAFPGIEWAQSLREALEYAASRVRPSAKHLEEREHSAKSDDWAAQSQWAHLSQGRRIIRWVTSRQTRPVTMHAVNAALRCPP
ncbi:MAG TPA: nucleotidyltransferase family protein [Steroidobacteraceae bacterium]|nr:nucleotidyltransferase family protein [Steroidobacteraceae bacterium]